MHQPHRLLLPQNQLVDPPLKDPSVVDPPVGSVVVVTGEVDALMPSGLNVAELIVGLFPVPLSCIIRRPETEFALLRP